MRQSKQAGAWQRGGLTAISRESVFHAFESRKATGTTPPGESPLRNALLKSRKSYSQREYKLHQSRKMNASIRLGTPQQP